MRCQLFPPHSAEHPITTDSRAGCSDAPQIRCGHLQYLQTGTSMCALSPISNQHKRPFRTEVLCARVQTHKHTTDLKVPAFAPCIPAVQLKQLSSKQCSLCAPCTGPDLPATKRHGCEESRGILDCCVSCEHSNRTAKRPLKTTREPGMNWHPPPRQPHALHLPPLGGA